MADDYGPGLDAAHPDNEWTFRACVIRFGPGVVNGDGTFASGGPYIHVNSGHIAVGVQGVHVEPDGDVVVDLDGGAISAILATPDETLTVRGIAGGPSGAAGNTVFRFRKDGVGKLNLATQAHWNLIAAAEANLWCFWATCTTRGIGLPSKADRALEAIASLQAAVSLQAATIEALSQQVAYLQSLAPGSFGAFDSANAGKTFDQLDTEQAGQTFSDFDAAN